MCIVMSLEQIIEMIHDYYIYISSSLVYHLPYNIRMLVKYKVYAYYIIGHDILLHCIPNRFHNILVPLETVTAQMVIIYYI